jgi:hypothetical protein
MLTWMLYVVVVTLLLSAAALAAERAARLRRGRTRWIWVLTILASLGIPSVIASVSVQVPNLVTPTVSRKITALREMTSVPVAPLSWVRERTVNTAGGMNLSRMLQRSWIVVSAALVVALLLNGVQVFWRKRWWRMGVIAGTTVYIAPAAGPAVVGLLRPRIVVPTWILETCPSHQIMIIAHEQAHLAGHDPQVLTVALFLLVLMPWNLPLWWQLHRLRYAIEVDCDARVLESRLDTKLYGEMLIEVSQRPSDYIGAVAAMSESHSFLEERITIMTRSPTRWGVLSAAMFACLAFALFATATQVIPPNVGAAGDGGKQSAVVLPTEVLDRYAGYYQRSEHALVRMWRDGAFLFAQLTGTPRAQLVPQSETEFAVPDVPDALFTFLLDASGRVNGVRLRRAFYTFVMPRIDTATAEQILANSKAKIQGQTPTPGNDAVLRRTIDAIRANKPNFADMTPWLADLVRQTLPLYRDQVTEWGPIRSIQFLSINIFGGDVYEVHQDGGTSYWMISLNSAGLIEDINRSTP